MRKFVKKIWMDEIEVIDNWSEARKEKKSAMRHTRRYRRAWETH